MTDFLLELRCEEIPARMQLKASADLARLFTERLAEAGLKPEKITSFVTPRRLALIAHGLPAQTEAVSEEYKGPRTSAPPQALEGFLRKTGLTQDQLEDRDGIWFAVVEKPGRATAEVLAEAVPAVIRAFPWPKSMRWGDASTSTESLRWVRPLQGIVAILGEDLVEIEVEGIRSGYATLGHRFHHPGPITIGSAHDYAEKLRACHVIVSHEERQQIIAGKAAALAAERGYALVEDQGLVIENAGLTEWPVPLLGTFDPAFLEVPPEVIQLTLRINQKYFVLRDAEGRLAPAFICTANIEAKDHGAAIVAGNGKVLAARLSDARFFWEQDRKTTLAEHAAKLERITFHEKLGTLADRVDRIAKLARWLVEEGIVKSSPERGGGPRSGGGAPSVTSPFRGGFVPGRPRRTGRPPVQGRPRHRNGRRVPGTPGPDGRLLRPRRGLAGRRGRRHPRPLQAGRAGR
jgi:glycyl-tRNA synthetase beta chain